MKKLTGKKIAMNIIGAILFAAVLFVNLKVGGSQFDNVAVNSDLATFTASATVSAEDYQGLAKYNPTIFDCYCVNDGCQKCACGC
jgi:hypothetical protein